MSIRNLDSLLCPATVVVVGASPRPGSLGALAWRHLREGGFEGPLMALNPHHRLLDGIAVQARVRQLPQVAELAVICTPPATVPKLIAQLGAHGTRAAVVLTPGLDAAQCQDMLDAARPHLLRVVGPGGTGVQVPHLKLNASIAASAARPGSLALLSPSNGLLSGVLDWAAGRGVGFSHVVSLGGKADVDAADLLDYLGNDGRTRAILLHVESIRAARKFMSAARAAARNKPVIVIKARGGLADAAFDAAVRRAGMLRVDGLQDLFVAAQTLSHFRPVRGDDETPPLTIVTNSHGVGLLAADAARRLGVSLAVPSPQVAQALATLCAGRTGNPVDLPAAASPADHARALQLLLDDPASGTLLFVHAPVADVPAADVAEAALPVVQPLAARVLACWLGDPSVSAARQRFQAAGVACCDTPESAVRAHALTTTYRSNQQQLMQAPPAHDPSTLPARGLVRARRLVDAALGAGSDTLDDADTRAVLKACGIAISRRVGRSPDVALRVSTRVDPLFGPVIAFGPSGVVDEASPCALALPPLNEPLARDLMACTGVSRRLQAGAERPAADEASVVGVLVRVSQLLAEVPEIASLQIDPLLAGPQGAVARHGSIRLSKDRPGGSSRFAIRPYPGELVETLHWRGKPLTLRPIRPQDEAQHLRFLSLLDPGDIRMRVFYSRRSIERSELARLTQIDYEREMAFLATRVGDDGVEETLAVVRAVIDPGNVEAEFGIIVRSDIKAGGLGRLLMHKLIGYLQGRGTQRLVATVLAENTRMLDLARHLGFTVDEATPDEPDVHHIRLALTAQCVSPASGPARGRPSGRSARGS